jgi:hypothetical protein
MSNVMDVIVRRGVMACGEVAGSCWAMRVDEGAGGKGGRD